MEGASIVSHAAEIRGMDSADEESELPSAVKNLIRHLEGKVEPIDWLMCNALSGEEFRDFFPERESLSTIIGWRSQVRLLVLETIGNCNMLRDLDFFLICGGDISRLTASEWEIVLKGFRFSTVLESILIRDLKWSSDAEVESLCLQIGKILNTSSVQSLSIEHCRLSTRCFLNLASGLRGNSDSQLQSLNLDDAWEESSAAKHVADMINSASRLEVLYLLHLDAMEEETVGILSQALIQSSSLKLLCLDKVDWGVALLLNALAGDDGNRSIERLSLGNMDGLGGCLRELLTSNPSLKEVELYRLQMSPEEWHQLGEFIRDKVRATTTTVRCYLDQNDRDDWKSIETFACAASSDVKDPSVELVLEPLSDQEFMLSLNLLGRVLRGEINSLKSFHIWARHPRTSGTNQDRPESMLPMNGKSGETSVLKRLSLNVESKGLWKDLLWCLRGNTSLTHLDLSDNEGATLDEEAFKDLMGLLQVNLTLQEIDVSDTSWETDGKGAQIQEALKQNQKRASTSEKPN
ncbi:hypothetical protein MPTK1_3g19100 [Marchantia polymorpha subsp. ruderalis]|uniref:Uncharacterized protein n=1 Tax=Marchantia polymorpha subsp. ruderalis TaxID=1480154 RepID=A0AAF6B2E8_MARPO|nr:hypothetical protein Mp_3g19100 [Marchantia polymorpha subsp. ruderalis]